MPARRMRSIDDIEFDHMKAKMPRLTLGGADIIDNEIEASGGVISDSENTVVDLKNIHGRTDSKNKGVFGNDMEIEELLDQSRRFSRSATPEPDIPSCFTEASHCSDNSDDDSFGSDDSTKGYDVGPAVILEALKENKEAAKKQVHKVFAAMTDLQHPDARFDKNGDPENLVYVTHIMTEEEEPIPDRDGCGVLSINKSFDGAVSEVVEYFEEFGVMQEIMEQVNEKHAFCDSGNDLGSYDAEDERDAIMELAELYRLDPRNPVELFKIKVVVQIGSMKHVVRVETMFIGC